MTPVVAPMGDTAAVVRVGSTVTARRLARSVGLAVEAAATWTAGVEDVVAGAESIVVVVDALRADAMDVAGHAAALPAATGKDRPAGAADRSASRHHLLPVVFDGEDAGEVAAGLGCTVPELAATLAGNRLEVAFLGFLPGFAYLDGLPPALAAIPRRAQPRTCVPAGSVALAGGYAGVYPLASPGGWKLLGRTDAALLDPSAAPYAVLAPGDTVGFRQVAEVGPPPALGRPPLVATGSRRAVVLEPGPLTTVQDAGRRGVAACGIPRGGPADPAAMALANALVGNLDGAGVLEVTYQGPTLRFEDHCLLAVVGEVVLEVGGRPMPACTVEAVHAGTTVSVGRVEGGARAYLAVAGGFEPEAFFGSRSGDTVSGLGFGRLRSGDQLAFGLPGRARGRCTARRALGRPAVLRVLPGPGPDTPFEPLQEGPFEVDRTSDRAGTRLVPSSRPAGTGGPSRVLSQGMVTGAVQLPPDGRPIILGPDHGTVGGYGIAGVVISADLPVVGQLRPGDAVRFEAVDLATARRAAEDLRHDLRRSVTGWYPNPPA